MLLFINIFLTNHRLYGYNRGNLPGCDRFEIFKYTIASYASINRWSKCIFYIQLDNEFLPRKEELKAYIEELFGDVPMSFYWHRNVYTREWRQAAEEALAHDDNLIWLTCNDDHVFIDYDHSMIDEAISHLSSEAEPMTTMYFSHWPEIIRVAALESKEGAKGRFVPYWWNVHDSIQIVRKEVFKSYWFDYDFGDKSVARTDVIHDYTDPKMRVKCYAPTREICRHFDGYSHVGQLLNVAPPLTIPPGFFEKNIKVMCYSHERRDGWYSINPMASDFYAHEKSGTDAKLMLEDLPLFWKDRIREVETHKRPRKQLCEARNDAFLAMTKAVGSCFCRGNLPLPPAEWLAPHLRCA